MYQLQSFCRAGHDRHIVPFKNIQGEYWKYGISRTEAPGRYTLQDASHDGLFCGYHYYIYRLLIMLNIAQI